MNYPAQLASSNSRSTFRTLAEVLSEITLLVTASAEALRDLENSDRLCERDAMLVKALIQSRVYIADSLEASSKDASSQITARWLQYDPVGDVGWEKLNRVRQATSGEQATALIAEFDNELQARLECLRTSESSNQGIWHQVITLFELSKRATSQIFQSAQQV